MTTPNIDTKALRELESAAQNRSLTFHERGEAFLKFSDALHRAAPALLDLADRAQEQAKEIEEYTEACQRAADEIGRRMYAEDKLTAERDALKAEVEAERNESRGYREQFKTAVGHYTALRARLGLDGFATVEEVLCKVDTLRAKLSASEREAERLREALTPSGETKFAYMNEFKFNVVREGPDHSEIVERHAVPWTTLKDIMAAISKRAALRGEEAPRE